MKTIWTVIWLASNCGTLNAPVCIGETPLRGYGSGDCKCTAESKDFTDQIDAEKFAMLRAGKVVSVVKVEESTPTWSGAWIQNNDRPFMPECKDGCICDNFGKCSPLSR